MADLLSNLRDNELPVAEIIPAIGLTAYRWTQVEIVTQRMLAALADVQPGIDIALSLHIPDRTALEIILAIARMRGFEKALLESIESFQKAHGTCRENRNLIVHGTVARSEPGAPTDQIFIQKASARSSFKVANYAISSEIIYRVSEECRGLAGYGQVIVRHLDALRGGQARTALAQLFPQLDSLTKTLPQVPMHDVVLPRELRGGWVEAHQHPQHEV